MNKDALLATVIGFLIGVAITGGILFAPKVAKYLPHIQLPRTLTSLSFLNHKNQPVEPTPKTAPPPSAIFSVTSPLDQSLADSDSILVSGTAPAGTYVTIGGLSDESAVLVGKDGKFAGKISLGEGTNEITVSAFSGETVTNQKITVYYTPEKF
jgi:hypothetical protein